MRTWVGTDLALAIHDYILKYLEHSPNPSPLLKEKVKQGKLGFKGFKSGEGFQKWSAEDAQKSRNALVEYLLEVTRKS
jgi:3-hydroxybutyryl-CoA dehydrogenase